MDSDEQSTQSFENITFEFTLSVTDTDSDSESDTSVEYMGTNFDNGQQTDGNPISSVGVGTASISLTQQDAVSSLFSLYSSNETLDNSSHRPENNISPCAVA
jgi:hypothetical protein